jgi:hypothetical protein
MASKYWIKLYHEMLHDPKVMRLEDHLFRRFIEMLLYAGETDSDGILPCLADMAWTLRADEKELTDDLAALSEAGLVEETDGGWLVSNFAKRQEPDREARPQSATAEWRSAVFTRDKYTCQSCGRRGVSLEAHHVRPWFLDVARRFDVTNGVSLCRRCHRARHKAGWKRRAIEGGAS